MQLVDYPPWYQQVIAIFKHDLSVSGFQHAASFVYKDDLIGLAVFIKIIGHRVSWCRQRDMQIAVYEHGLAAIQKIVGWRNIESLEAGMLQVFLTCHLRLCRIRFANLLYERRRVAMVYQRVGAGETVCGYQFLRIQAAIGLAKHGMSFCRDFP